MEAERLAIFTDPPSLFFPFGGQKILYMAIFLPKSPKKKGHSISITSETISFWLLC